MGLGKAFYQKLWQKPTLVTWLLVFASDAYDVPYKSLQAHDDIEYGRRPDHRTLDDSQDDAFSGGSKRDKRKHAATVLNRYMQQQSSTSKLVVTNMPLIRRGKPASDFFDYIDVMVDGIENVLLVQGAGTEVITTYV